jgi:hypothetical protein
VLYLPGKTLDVWPKLFGLLSLKEPLDLVMWLYPGRTLSELPLPFSQKHISEDLERVTVYSLGEEPPATSRFRVNDELLKKVKGSEKKLVKVCDDFALYRPGERTWVACSIPHEDMSLVKESVLLSELQSCGLAVLTEPPAGW